MTRPIDTTLLDQLETSMAALEPLGNWDCELHKDPHAASVQDIVFNSAHPPAELVRQARIAVEAIPIVGLGEAWVSYVFAHNERGRNRLALTVRYKNPE